jgi:hypothetical protein
MATIVVRQERRRARLVRCLLAFLAVLPGGCSIQAGRLEFLPGVAGDPGAGADCVAAVATAVNPWVMAGHLAGKAVNAASAANSEFRILNSGLGANGGGEWRGELRSGR